MPIDPRVYHDCHRRHCDFAHGLIILEHCPCLGRPTGYLAGNFNEDSVQPRAGLLGPELAQVDDFQVDLDVLQR